MLKNGADPAVGAGQLADMILTGPNVTSGGGGPQGVVSVRNAYLDWIEQVEACLRGITDDLAHIEGLFTAQYWAIRAMPSDWRAVSDPRPYPLVDNEVGRQIHRLRWLLDDLNARPRAAAATGPDGARHERPSSLHARRADPLAGVGLALGLSLRSPRLLGGATVIHRVGGLLARVGSPFR
jgi:hypothetical protein